MTETHHMTETTIAKATERILELAPELTSRVRGSKTDDFTYFFSDDSGEVSAKWVNHSKLGVELGFAKKGSHVIIKRLQ